MVYPIVDMASRLAHIIMKVLLPVVVLVIGTSSVQAAYSVAGYVVDAKTGQNIPGSANSSIYVYADNSATVYKSYPDNNGYWQIANLADGPHSIEIANAGSLGWAPASAEKIQTNSARSDLTFRLMRGGYDVVGRVIDTNGSGIGNLTVYADFPNRASTQTDYSGNYRLTNLSFGGAGHNIYVETSPTGWEVVSNPAGRLVNPTAPTSEVRVDFTLRNISDQPVQPFANCSVAIQSTSGNTSPVYVTLSGNFTSNNPGLYYPTRYEWDFNGDRTTDVQTPTNAFAMTSPQGTIYNTASSAVSYQPKLKVYYNGSASPVECASPTTIFVNPPPYAGGSTAMPYCTVSASPTYGNAPFYSTISGNFYNSGSVYYQPTQYRFFVGYLNQTVLSNQFQHSYSQYLPSSGSYPVRLEVTHSSGSTVTCYGPTLTVNVNQNTPVILSRQTTTLSSAKAENSQAPISNAATAAPSPANSTAYLASQPAVASTNHTNFSTIMAYQSPTTLSAAAINTNPANNPTTANQAGFGAIIAQTNPMPHYTTPSAGNQNISLAPQTGSGEPSVLETFAHFLSGAISIFVGN